MPNGYHDRITLTDITEEKLYYFLVRLNNITPHIPEWKIVELSIFDGRAWICLKWDETDDEIKDKIEAYVKYMPNPEKIYKLKSSNKLPHYDFRSLKILSGTHLWQLDWGGTIGTPQVVDMLRNGQNEPTEE